MARENYEKYGHPDGPQSVKLDIALPDWVFSQVCHPLYMLQGALVTSCERCRAHSAPSQARP